LPLSLAGLLFLETDRLLDRDGETLRAGSLFLETERLLDLEGERLRLRTGDINHEPNSLAEHIEHKQRH